MSKESQDERNSIMKNVKNTVLRTILLGCVTLSLVGCASSMNYDEPLCLYEERNPQEALVALENNQESYLKEDGPIVYGLNAGMVAHSAGAFEDSNDHFERAEERIAASYTTSISKNVASYLVSENTRSYDSPNYEDIYTNLFKALNYYKMGSTEEAMVEVRRMNEKISYYQNETPLAEDERVQYNSFKYQETNYPPLTHSGLAQYLSALLSYEYGDDNYFNVSLKKIDNALRTEGLFYDQDAYQSIERLESLDADTTIVSFLSFSGLAPKKVATSSRGALIREAYKDEDGYYHRALYNDIVYSVPMVRNSQIKSVRVNIDGKLSSLEPFENISTIAFSSMVKKSKAEYTRAFIRILTREIGKAVVHEQAESDEEKDFASLFSSALNLFTVFSEQADVRCSLFFPARSWIQCLPLEPGLHTIRVEYLDSNGFIIDCQSYENFNVVKGKANLIETVSPL